jgi:hypothetical protein
VRACRQVAEVFPAGIVTLRGTERLGQAKPLSLAHREEEAEKKDHPLNRVISIEADADAIVINTTDIGPAKERAVGLVS